MRLLNYTMRLILPVFLLSLCFPTVVHIPADYSTIQRGIDETLDGDTILVETGTYDENINFNGKKFHSTNGLKDLLERKNDVEKIHYPVIHLKGDDIEIAMTHGDQYGEEYYSFVNGQHTTQGGTHLASFRESLVKTIREYYKKDFETAIIEYEKVLIYMDTDKYDDSQFKIGLSYQNMGKIDKALEYFQRIIDKYPNGEYYGKATEQVKQLSIE